MNWKYIKGTKEDFEGAPSWATESVWCDKGGNSFAYWLDKESNKAQTLGNLVVEWPGRYGYRCWVEAQREPIKLNLTIPNWDGVGLPPVGTKCEYSLNGGDNWWNCEIAYIVGNQGIVMLCDVFEGAQYVDFTKYEGKLKFRPFRSEADKKRDVAIEAIEREFKTTILDDEVAKVIYDAIVAGKIPGVTLEVDVSNY